ncbi:MAG: hypothetical protein QOI07_1291 [Verrucomicrobiota bacterium]|jgi:hypothetical protein
MNQISLALSRTFLFFAASIASGQTVVNSTFVGGDFAHLYSNAANWAPAEVPNNSGTRIYDVTVPFFSVNVDIDATVRNLTLTGQGLDLGGGHSYTITGTASVGPNSSLSSSGALAINGSLLNFESASKTLSGGRYSVFGVDGRAAGILSFPRADIVNNGASISLLGPTSMISDEAGRDALRNFAHNLAGASFAVVARDYTINNVFTNDGFLTVGVTADRGLPAALRSSLTTNRLTNYNSQSNRLAGGSYDIIASAGTLSGIPAEPAQLIVAGADIRRNAASITLEVSGAGDLVYDPSFTDENGNNALRNFVENEATGFFQLRYLSHPFQLTSDFTNAGTVTLQMSSLSVPASHAYRQVAGRTNFTGGGITGNVEISGGELLAVEGLNQANSGAQTPTINGNLTVGNALIDPIALNVNGSVVLSDGTRFFAGFTRSGKGLTAQSTMTLAGTLEIQSPSTTTIAHAAAISGVFKNAPNGSRVSTIDGGGSYVVTYTSTDVTLTNYQPATPTPQLLNLSARAQVLTGDHVAIGGFIITGSDFKNVVIRAMGPSLTQAGVPAPLQDPVIELHDSKGALITSNDNWSDSQGIELNATGVAPKDPHESAIFAALAPGAYTAVVRGNNDTTGTALIEVYDLSSGSQTKLANISTRGFVDADHVLIGGMIAGGNAQDRVHVVVRAIGAGLQSSGVQDFLPDAALEVRDKNGALVAANDDFGTPADNQTTVPPGLRPSNPTDAATGTTLAPGNYTVIVSGKNGATGNALVEIYDLNG